MLCHGVQKMSCGKAAGRSDLEKFSGCFYCTCIFIDKTFFLAAIGNSIAKNKSGKFRNVWKFFWIHILQRLRSPSKTVVEFLVHTWLYKYQLSDVHLVQSALAMEVSTKHDPKQTTRVDQHTRCFALRPLRGSMAFLLWFSSRVRAEGPGASSRVSVCLETRCTVRVSEVVFNPCFYTFLGTLTFLGKRERAFFQTA